jgi:hypothetical protein
MISQVTTEPKLNCTSIFHVEVKQIRGGTHATEKVFSKQCRHGFIYIKFLSSLSLLIFYHITKNVYVIDHLSKIKLALANYFEHAHFINDKVYRHSSYPHPHASGSRGLLQWRNHSASLVYYLKVCDHTSIFAWT